MPDYRSLELIVSLQTEKGTKVASKETYVPKKLIPENLTNPPINPPIYNPWTNRKYYSLIPIPLGIGCYFLGQNFDQESNDYHEQYKEEIWDKNKDDQYRNKANDYNAYKEYSYDAAIGLGIVSLISFFYCWHKESRYAKGHDLESKYGTEIDIEGFPQEVKFSLVLRY